MQIFKTFWKITVKHLSSIIMYFVIFGVITAIVSGSVGKENTDTYNGASTKISITDNDSSPLSIALTDYLSSICSRVEIGDSKEEMQDSLFFRNVDYILIIPNGFENSFKDNGNVTLENIKIPSSRTGALTDQCVDRFLSTVKLYTASGCEMEEAVKKAAETLADETKVTLQSFDSALLDSDSSFYFYSYLPYVFIMIIFCGLCPILITFSKKDFRSRTDCSALTKKSRTAQLTSASIIYALGTWVLFMIYGFITYGSDMVSGKGLLYMLNSIIFMICTAGIALVISSFTLSTPAVTMIANCIGLGMSFLCGVFVPQWLLGDGIIAIARFLPAFWCVRANNMLAGAPGYSFTNQDFYICIGVQLLFAAVFFMASYVITRMKRKA